MEKYNTRLLAVIAYLCCALVWGTTWYSIRVCIGEGGYPTIAGAAARFTIASMLLFAVVRVWRISPGMQSRRQWSWIGAAGALNGLCYGLLYLSEETVPGSIAAILFGTTPLLTALLASISKTETLSRRGMLGACIALVGIVVVFHDRLSVSSEQGDGMILLCLSVLVGSIYSIVLKREGEGVHVLASTTWFLAVSAAVLWLTALALGDAALPWPPPMVPTVALLYLALFGSVLTFSCYLYLLQRVTLRTTTTLVLVQPIVAIVVDSQWEPDVQLSFASYLGAGLAATGVALSILRKGNARVET